MAFVNYAVMDMDITAWTVKGSCHGIFTSLHADSIVSRLECTVMDVDIGTGLHIDSISVLSIVRISHLYMIDSQIFTEKWVQIPCRRIHKCHTLKQDLLTMPQAQQHRAVKIIIICCRL